MRDSLIIMPAYNEEKNIGKVLSDIEDLGIDADVLIVNDGSSDGTEAVVKKHGIGIISLPYNLGYGAALQTGFKYAVRMGYKFIVQFDSDGQHNPQDIIKMLECLKKEDVDIVIGSRFLGNGTLKTGFMKNLAIKMFRFLIRYLSGSVVTDPTSGFKGMTSPVFGFFSRMGRYPVDYPDADIIIQMIRCRYRVVEIPANMRHRSEGKSMHSGLKPIYYFIKIILSILIVLLREKIMKEGCEYYG